MIGMRYGAELKIPRLHGRAGSIPAAGTALSSLPKFQDILPISLRSHFGNEIRMRRAAYLTHTVLAVARHSVAVDGFFRSPQL